ARTGERSGQRSWTSSIIRHTARPDPRPIVIPSSIRSSAAAAAASRAASVSLTPSACHGRVVRPMPGTDALVYIARPPAGDPEGALVLLHGRGTSEHDLASLLD